MALEFLSRLFPRRLDVEHLKFTVYTRAQCTCCRKALDLLEERRRRCRFQLETVDVDGDPELAALYGGEVPVVAVDGRIRFRGVVQPALLDRLLLAESRNRRLNSNQIKS